jgi:hypothetical protein
MLAVGISTRLAAELLQTLIDPFLGIELAGLGVGEGLGLRLVLEAVSDQV